MKIHIWCSLWQVKAQYASIPFRYVLYLRNGCPQQQCTCKSGQDKGQGSRNCSKNIAWMKSANHVCALMMQCRVMHTEHISNRLWFGYRPDTTAACSSWLNHDMMILPLNALAVKMRSPDFFSTSDSEKSLWECAVRWNKTNLDLEHTRNRSRFHTNSKRRLAMVKFHTPAETHKRSIGWIQLELKLTIVSTKMLQLLTQHMPSLRRKS